MTVSLHAHSSGAPIGSRLPASRMVVARGPLSPRLFRKDHLFLASRNAISSAFGFPAETLRSRRRLVRLVVEGSVSFVQTIFLRAVPRFPLIAKGSPLFAPAQSWALVGLSILLTSHQVPSPWHLTASHSLEFQARPRRRDDIHANVSARSLLSWPTVAAIRANEVEFAWHQRCRLSTAATI